MSRLFWAEQQFSGRDKLDHLFQIQKTTFLKNLTIFDINTPSL